MSLNTRLGDLITALGTDYKQVRVWITGSSSGDLTGLTTTAKTSLVAAINEVKAAATGAPPNATETAVGVGEIATTAEVTAGADDFRWVTALKLQQRLVAFAQPLSSNLTTLAGLVSTATGRSILTAPDATSVKTTLGLATVATSGSAADLTGILPSSALPPLAIVNVSVVASQAAMLALTAQRGDVAKRTDLNGTAFILSTDNPGTLADWISIDTTSDVSSVAGRTGTVVLTKADVGLSAVDNTSDAAKPVSTAQAAADNLRQPIDPTLTALAGVTVAANQMILATGVDAFTTVNTGAIGRALLADATAADARTELSVYSQAEIGAPETDLVALYALAKA